MSRDEILAAIPHRPPFLLIDRVVERSTDRIRCSKTFDEGDYFFAGHYPGFPIVPGVLLCEAAMQAGAVLLAGQVDASGKVPVATRIGDVRFKRMVRPGDTVEIEVELTERLSGAFFLKAKVSVGTAVAARLEFACTLAPMPAESDNH